MNTEKNALINQAIEDAHRQAEQIATCIIESFDGNPDERNEFIKSISTLYDMMNDSQFFAFLDILFEVFDIVATPSKAAYSSNEFYAFAHNTMFIQYLALFIMFFDGEAV